MNASDLDAYRRCYCESCHQLKANFGIVSTAAVNYDMTFNAMILNAVSKNGIEKQSVNKGVVCVLAKRTADSEILKKIAAYTLLLTKWELEDDRQDHPNLKSNAAYLLLGRAIRKAERRYPEYDEYVAKGFETLRKMEYDGCTDAADIGRTFASSLMPAMKDIAADPWNENLEGLFVSLGTMIYLTDAVDDLDEDYMNGTYNPFLVNCERFINKTEYMKENTYAIAELMNNAMKNVQTSYLTVRGSMRFHHGVTDNVIYHGLPGSAKNAMTSKRASTGLRNTISSRILRNDGL